MYSNAKAIEPSNTNIHAGGQAPIRTATMVAREQNNKANDPFCLARKSRNQLLCSHCTPLKRFSVQKLEALPSSQTQTLVYANAQQSWLQK
jgi:hypothetical protein